MSVDGVEKKVDLSLVEAIMHRKEPLALVLIGDEGIDLHQKDTRNYEPIHWAAMNDMKDTFIALLQKGVNPFTPGGPGQFSAYQFSKKRHAIKALCLSFFPHPFEQEKGLPDNQLVNEALLDHGFHPYLINPLNTETEQGNEPKNLKQQMIILLKQLLADGPLPPYVGIENAKPSKRTEKAPKQTLVESAFLTQIARGMIDEKIPFSEILQIITGIYPTLPRNQQLACVYLVKEFIRLDRENQWITTKEFRDEFDAFLEKVGANLLTIKSVLEKFYLSKLPKSHLFLPLTLSLDLAKAFRDSVMRITPISFRTENLIDEKKKQDNTPFLEFSEFTSKLSQLVCLDILKARNPKKGALLIEYYFEVMRICLNEKTKSNNTDLPYNLAAAFAIYNGLKFGAVSRLKNSWDKVSSECKEALNGKYEKTLNGNDEKVLNGKYEVLFDPKGLFGAMRQSILEHPNCIPPLNGYCGVKEKIPAIELLEERLAHHGTQREKFTEHQIYLKSLDDLSLRPYQTDIMDKLDTVYFDDTYTWALSYSLEPPKVINLDTDQTLASLSKSLKDMYDLTAPLVVMRGKKIFKQADAKKEIKAYLKQVYPQKVTFPPDEADEVPYENTITKESSQPKHEDEVTITTKMIETQCNETISNFKKALSFPIQPSPFLQVKIAVNSKNGDPVEELLDGVARLNLGDTSSLKSTDEGRNRSQTLPFGHDGIESPREIALVLRKKNEKDDNNKGTKMRLREKAEAQSEDEELRGRANTATAGFAPDVESKEERIAKKRQDRMKAFEVIKGEGQYGLPFNGLASSPSYTPARDMQKPSSSSAVSTPAVKEKVKAKKK